MADFLQASVRDQRYLRVVLLADGENTLLELDAAGRVCALTIEHATERTGIPTFTYQQVAAA